MMTPVEVKGQYFSKQYISEMVSYRHLVGKAGIWKTMHDLRTGDLDFDLRCPLEVKFKITIIPTD